MSYKEILDNVSNIENLDNVTILKTLQKFSRAIRDFAEKQTGLQNLLNVEFEPTENAVTYSNGVVDYLGNLKITLADNIIVNKPCSVKFNIKGSKTIIVDVDEFDNALEIHLDNSTITTLVFAESERVKSATDGPIVHENDIADLKQYPIQVSLRMSADQTNIPAYSNDIVEFTSITSSTDINNLISLNNGIISFDKKVKKVKLNGFIVFSNESSTTSTSINVYRNDTEILGYVSCKAPSELEQICIFQTPVIEISEGDTLSARVFSIISCNVQYFYTRLNVEVWL